MEDKKKNHEKTETTSDELIKIFEKKVKEYEYSSRLFFWSFILSILTIIFFAGSSWNPLIGRVLSWEVALTGTAASNPFLESILPVYFYLLILIIILAIGGLITWFLLFLSNRRAESKKLEEIYKHKAVMVRAFLGYRKILAETPVDEQKDKNQQQQDTSLLDGFIRNLLDALKQNPSDFIKSRADHPARYVFPLKTIKKILVDKGDWDSLLGLIPNILMGVIKQTLEKVKDSFEETKDSSEKAKDSSEKAKDSSDSKK